MAREWDKKFSELVNSLELLGRVFGEGKLEGEPIQEAAREATKEMSDEQLDAFGEYMRQRLRQSQQDAKSLTDMIIEAKAELARRKKP